ncbi:hypothetical protein QGN29_11870 [Temperatibacter marinus]|uniref:IPT/TIG domain-containing protein n=1 Tax=Temperatibacter marinus TaxID=1456591 RepID=A0AA52EEN7_9PROT|nr:hypothetical protein [Temperatibacter marinus]WND02248.1 hypothetical protein QGN29_11870 [Temperatibacter marinus]
MAISSDLNNKDKIKQLINNNPYENIFYTEDLNGSQDAVISEMNPDSIDEGSSATIICSVPPGLDAHAGTLRSLGGTYTSTSTGQVFVTDTVIINDPENYTEFAIVANDLPEDEYIVTILLGPFGKVGDTYRLTSDFSIIVKPAIAPRISTITPNMVSKSDLTSTLFQVTGRNLTKIQTSTGFYLVQPGFKLQFAGALTESTARVRYTGAILPQAGTYRVLAKNSEGNVIFSSANLTLSAD